MRTAPRLVVALIGLVVLASRAHGQDFEFCTNNGTITITRYIGPGGDVAIPDTINGLPVTEITFLGAARLTSIVIPNSVTNIALWICDGCTFLTAINVEPLNPAYSSRDGVLFDKGQTALLKLPLARAGGYMIPDGVSRIELGAFTGCTHLTSITIPSSLAVSNTDAFSCPSLTAINVDPHHPGYSSVDGVLLNKNQTALLRYPAARAGSYTLPDTVNRIDFDAFSGCRQLTSITIPPSVTSIGDSAFYECKVLSRIALPDGLISIEDRAFMGCTKLTDITIPSGVARIAAEAFKGCNSLAKITVPDSVRGINYGANGVDPGGSQRGV